VIEQLSGEVFMGHFSRWILLTSLLLLLLTTGVRAQDGENLKGFLADDSPALLFELNQLTLTNWNGGVGMMFSASEDLHWRFSISPRVSGRMDKSSDSTIRTHEGNYSTVGMYIGGGPVWVLYRKGDFCFTAGTGISYGITHMTSEYLEPNSPTEERSSTAHSIGLNGTFGAGFAVSRVLMLHAEYLFSGSYRYSSDKNQFRNRETERTEWSLGTTLARLGLIIRL
jgi:hypothetical protein